MAPETQPLVSVCIPVYQGGRLLGVAIESVLSQSLQDFELIIVDDQSPDDSFQVASRYGDPRIRLYQNPVNLGPEGNWNRCLALARGRYVKLLPQDDVLSRKCLERQLDAFGSPGEPSPALVFCARTIVDSMGKPIMRRGYRGSPGERIDRTALVRRCVRSGTNLIGEPGGVLFPRDLAEIVGMFDASIPYVVDLDYWFRLMEHGDACYLDEPLVSFRVSTGSWSVSIGLRQGTQFCQFLEKAKARSSFRFSFLDLALGKTMAHCNALLRYILYRTILPARS